MLERIIDIRDNNRQHDTYYVYDEYGNLRYVLPPMASDRLTAQGVSWDMDTEDVAKYCYCYQYDTRNLCISKKLPGCEPVLMRYDKAHRLVFSQDGNLRTSNKWHVTVYDGFGRACFDGLCSGDSLPDVKQIEVKATFTNGPVGSSPRITGGTLGYSLNINLNDIEPLSAKYFDSYNFLDYFVSDIRYPLRYRDRIMEGYSGRYYGIGAYSTRGLLTGIVNCVLGDSALLVKSLYYDDHDNIIQTRETNAVGGYDYCYYNLSFTGKPLKVKHVHETADTTLTDVYEYTYDNMERLLTATVSHGGGAAVTLASNTYNSLGQLSEQALGSNVGSVVDYTYNVRGWTQTVTNPHFSQTLYYEQPVTGATSCYNGNISAVEWTSRDAMAAVMPTTNRYTFSYDGNNRLTSANYTTVAAVDINGTMMIYNDRDYNTTYRYDLNGNITSLTRKGVAQKFPVFQYSAWNYGTIDNLTMNYDGNQLKKVTDQCPDLTYAGAMDFKDGADLKVEYLWDANGNMTRDLNKKIWRIKYNVLNLPELIEYEDGHIVRYTYAADGRKLRVEYLESNVAVIEQGGLNVVGGTQMEPMGGGGLLPSSLKDSLIINPGGHIETTLLTMDYCGNHIYRNGVLERTVNDYGYQADSTYYYYVKDYQGNVRAVIDQNGALKEINNYYPYGGLMGGAVTGIQPAKYGGKELDRENGIDWYDFEARYQDPMLPMFTTIDPLAEQAPGISPYAYCAGNPIRYIDPTGKSTKVIYSGNSHYIVIGGDFDNDRNIYLYQKDRNGNYTVKGKSIGVSTSETSFYNSDENSWANGAIINLNDNSGRYFLNKMASEDITLDDYMLNATNNSPYDFKVTNGGPNRVFSGRGIYRGMPIGGKTSDGKLLISSARDIGNIAAGIVAAKNGISWKKARIAFDTYQSIKNIENGLHPGVEGLSTQNAEKYGWSLMSLHSNTHSELYNLWNSFQHFLKGLFK